MTPDRALVEYAVETPYYLIDENRLLDNLKTIRFVRNHGHARCVLALKCFSTWSLFGLMRQYLDGTTSSSLYEARLGYETFGKEVHVYSVAFDEAEIQELRSFSSKIIFNSISQLQRFHSLLREQPPCPEIGLRVNPQVSYCHFDLADPARPHSRLGVIEQGSIRKVLPLISGLMFHYNCENTDFENFCTLLDTLGEAYGALLRQLDWVSLGGGITFTLDGYPLTAFCEKLKAFSERYGLQVYLEPGEAVVTGAAWLVTRVLDVVSNEAHIAIIDSSVEAHMLDLLIYREGAEIEGSGEGGYCYTIAGKSCLAGDLFGSACFQKPLQVGDTVRIADAAGYTMVKKNWFNGVKMPAIVIKRLDGSVEQVKRFDYQDYKSSMS
jgi:carboxynorspermidine decarboxylase